MADRDRLIQAGMGAVFIACGVFAVARAGAQLQTGQATAWWVNALGFFVLFGVGLYYRGDRGARGTFAVHATGVVTLVALVVPVFYGMSSSVWWLSLLGFAMAMLARRSEAIGWALVVLITVILVSMVEPMYRVPSSLGESPLEVLLARVVFVLIVMGLGWAFRAAAESRARELTAAAEELARANAAKGRFFALMSHELRTPLHGVIAMTDLALREELTGSARGHVSTAHTSARLLLRMLNDVLDAGFQSVDALSLEPDTFRLHSMIGDVLRPLARQALERGLRFRAMADEGLPEARHGDPTRVAQIVLNLCANALKFTSEGHVHVHLSSPSPSMVRIVVDDSGRGVPEDMRLAVFEPFSQVEQADATLGGAGLGLNIVRELTDRMNGSAVCEASPSGGARFVIELELPVRDEAPGPVDLLDSPTAASLPPSFVAPPPIRILAAEDDPTNQLVLRALALRLGHTIEVVADGVEALQALRDHDYDVLLTDLQMPRMDGFGLIEHLRGATGNLAGIPIVVCSAQLTAEDVKRLEYFDVWLHLLKPFTLAALKTVLEQVRAEP